MGTDLIPAGDASPYTVLRMPESELLELIRVNIGGDSLSEANLDRVRVPAAGGTTWTIADLDGEQTMKSLDGVILYWATRRVYWENQEPDGSPPACQSPDGEFGYGEPGGPCVECPLNVFGSDPKNGRGKACKELRQIFILPEDSIIPIVVTAPPGSLRTVQEYFLRLLRKGLPSTAVVTSLKLEATTNKGGQKFSRIVASRAATLDADARARIQSLASALRPAFEAAGRQIDHNEIADDGDE